MQPDKIIIAPVLTEKTNAMREAKVKKYTFRVDARANKLEVMQAIKELFSVRPLSCNIITAKPKPRSSRSRSALHTGRTSSWKKAIITLKETDKIDVFEGA